MSIRTKDFEILIAAPKHLNESISCLNRNFCKYEPISKALCLKLPEFEGFVEIFTKRSIINGHTVIATYQNQVIGCLVAENFELNLPEGYEKLHEKMDPVFSILHDLDQLKFEHKEYNKSQYLHLLMLSIDDGYHGLGLSDKLIEAMEDVAKKEGFHFAFGEATGPISQHLLQKHNYKCEYQISYIDYKYKDSYPYKSISDCDHCKLFVKDLST